VPGVNVSTLDLQLERGVLKLRGEIQGTCEDRAVSVEQRATEWSRAVTVPDGVDAEGLRAELGDGVLTVHLKKSDQARPRRVPIAVR
jgi:HSP20 family protein